MRLSRCALSFLFVMAVLYMFYLYAKTSPSLCEFFLGMSSVQSVVTLNTFSVSYVPRDTIICHLELPPGLKSKITKFLCQSPVVIFTTEGGDTSIEAHCHCSETVHPLQCIASQTLAKEVAKKFT